MNTVKKWFWPLSKKKIIIFILLIVVGFLIYNAFKPKQSQVLQFAEVKKQDIRSIVSSSGSLTGKNKVDLKFKSAGKLSYINVKVGEEVAAWQTIAGLDTQQLNIDLQQAQNTYRDKQAAAEKAEDDVKDHSKDETFAQKTTRTAAQAARDSAYDSVKEAQRAFQDVIIYTPIAGLITQTNPIPGQNITASDIIAQVVDFSEVFFDTDIDEADIGKVVLGQKAEVNLDAYPDKIFEGTVSEIIPQTEETSQGATVIKVRINLGKPEITFIQGLSGQASIILSEVKDVLTVPLEAVREESTLEASSSGTVFIEENKNIKPKKVKTGIKSDTDIEIKDGLSEGDKVLLNPPSQGSGNFQNRSQNPLGGFRFSIGGPSGGGYSPRR